MDPENVGEVQQAIPDCDCTGDYTCPNNPTLDFTYDEPTCGPWTKTQQAARCDAACSLPCVDSGWICE